MNLLPTHTCPSCGELHHDWPALASAGVEDHPKLSVLCARCGKKILRLRSG